MNSAIDKLEVGRESFRRWARSENGGIGTEWEKKLREQDPEAVQQLRDYAKQFDRICRLRHPYQGGWRGEPYLQQGIMMELKDTFDMAGGYRAGVLM